VACPTAGVDDGGPIADAGVAGGSAWREYERQKAAREARIKGRLGDRLGRVVLAVTVEPQPTRAWARGASGEAELGAALAELPGVTVLHDRRVPGTRGNIDHLVIAPAGVFVVDAKRYAGRIQIRGKGGLFRAEPRLYVGRRDCSQMADSMGWQVAAVERALASAVPDAMPPITPVLCFVKGEWPLLGRKASTMGASCRATEGQQVIGGL
jgi:hypothetical protein